MRRRSSATPATGAWLGAVAQRTRRMRFGPLVYILPLRHPLQVAEEICFLDQLSGGRFELGVGRGISPYELGFHGVDATESPAMYREALELLLAALTQEEVSFAGRFWHCDKVPVVLRPAQLPHPPLWYACGTPEAAVWAGAERRQHRLQRTGAAGGRNPWRGIAPKPRDRCPASACPAPSSSPKRGPRPRRRRSAAGSAMPKAFSGSGAATAPARCWPA